MINYYELFLTYFLREIGETILVEEEGLQTSERIQINNQGVP